MYASGPSPAQPAASPLSDPNPKLAYSVRGQVRRDASTCSTSPAKSGWAELRLGGEFAS